MYLTNDELLRKTNSCTHDIKEKEKLNHIVGLRIKKERQANRLAHNLETRYHQRCTYNWCKLCLRFHFELAQK